MECISNSCCWNSPRSKTSQFWPFIFAQSISRSAWNSDGEHLTYLRGRFLPKVSEVVTQRQQQPDISCLQQRYWSWHLPLWIKSTWFLLLFPMPIMKPMQAGQAELTHTDIVILSVNHLMLASLMDLSALRGRPDAPLCCWKYTLE